MGDEREAEKQYATLKAEVKKDAESKSLTLNCKHCGNTLDVRKFLYQDEVLYGIFDNCIRFEEQKLYSTLTEAILAFNEVPEELHDIQTLIEKYTHG